LISVAVVQNNVVVLFAIIFTQKCRLGSWSFRHIAVGIPPYATTKQPVQLPSQASTFLHIPEKCSAHFLEELK